MALNYVSEAPNRYIERHKLLKGANSLCTLIERADTGGRELINLESLVRQGGRKGGRASVSHFVLVISFYWIIRSKSLFSLLCQISFAF